MRTRDACSAPAAGARRWPCISGASATTSGCGRATRRWSTRCRRAAPTPSYLPDITLPDGVVGHARRSPTRSRDAELVVSAVPSHGCRAVMRARRRSLRRERRHRQRDEGARGRHAAADVGSDRRGSRARRIRSSCCRGRASRSKSRASCRPRSSPRRATPTAIELVQARVPRPVLPAVRQRRRRRRRDRRRAEEHHRDRRRRRRRARARPQRAGGADHARPRRDTRLACAAGGRRETLAGLSGLGDLVLTCTGNLSRNRHVGIELARGRVAARHSGGHEDGGRRRADDRRRARARRALRRRAADRDADGRSARRPRRRRATARRRADAAAAACRGGDARGC